MMSIDERVKILDDIQKRADRKTIATAALQGLLADGYAREYRSDELAGIVLDFTDALMEKLSK